MADDLMDKIVSLCKRRGFIFPSSEIYGGLANSWDFGPLGVELKNNLKNHWWKYFVQDQPDVYGIDTTVIMNSNVWQASGHLKNFQDPLVECKKCHERFKSSEVKEKCTLCGGQLTKARMFNLMFKTFFGPVEDEAHVVYLRPETAQGMFVNYQNILDTMRPSLPFGLAQIGKAFRNEITPGNFVFRTREFEQMELEYFVAERDWEKYFNYWLEEMKKWLHSIGLKKIKLKEVPEQERAHYSKRTVDLIYEFPFGLEELCGIAYRGDYDLKNHGFSNPPHIIEPTFGVERLVLALLLDCYHEEKVRGETRVVLQFKKEIAPIKVAVLPLSKNEALSPKAKEVFDFIKNDFPAWYDETQSIGRRYRRQDEVGTPYCLTIDFKTLDDEAVTVRDRDTMKQERIKITQLISYLQSCFKKRS